MNDGYDDGDLFRWLTHMQHILVQWSEDASEGFLQMQCLIAKLLPAQRSKERRILFSANNVIRTEI